MIPSAPALVLIGTLTLYAAIFVDYERITIPAYARHIKDLRRRLRQNAILHSHVLAGLIEVFRWHIRNVWDDAPTADALDMTLCLVQSTTNLALVKNLVRGTPAMTRPSYQAGAIMRPILTFIAWQTGNAVLHKSSVKALNAFVYCRVLIFLMNTTMTTNDMSRAMMYNIGVFVSAIVAIGEGAAFTYQMHAYILGVFGLAALNHWVATQALNIDRLPTPMQYTIHALETVGFAELSTLRALRKGSAALEVDRPGDLWAKAHPLTPLAVPIDPIVKAPVASKPAIPVSTALATAPVARLRLASKSEPMLVELSVSSPTSPVV